MSRPVVDVSVILPAWKAAGFVERSIASALASQGVTVEVVAVDDASPDETSKVLRRLADADPRIVADRLPENSGPSVARNRAIELATGRYIAVLDADDAMAPDRLASMASIADSSGADIVVDNMIEVDEKDHAFGDEPFVKSPAFAERCEIDLETWVAGNHPMKSTDCLGYLKPLLRRSKLVELGERYDPGLRNSEDYYLVANLLALGARMIYEPTAGYRYQRSASSTSHRLAPSHTRAWLDAETRFRDRFDSRLSAAERHELDLRGRALRDVHQLVSAIEAVKSKRIGAFFGLLAQDMRASAFTLTAFAKIAMGKALRRKLI